MRPEDLVEACVIEHYVLRMMPSDWTEGGRKDKLVLG